MHSVCYGEVLIYRLIATAGRICPSAVLFDPATQYAPRYGIVGQTSQCSWIVTKSGGPRSSHQEKGFVFQRNTAPPLGERGKEEKVNRVVRDSKKHEDVDDARSPTRTAW